METIIEKLKEASTEIVDLTAEEAVLLNVINAMDEIVLDEEEEEYNQ